MATNRNEGSAAPGSDRPRVGVVGLPGSWSTEALADALEQRTGFRLVVDLARVALDLQRGTALLDGVDLTKLDALVVKKLGAEYSPAMLERIEVLRFLQHMGVRVMSPPETLSRLVDRLACTVALRAAGIPMPETLVTEDVAQAVQAVERFGAAVFKPLYSTKARGMTIIEHGDPERVREQVEAFCAVGNPMMYIQKRLALPDRDLGVVFLGGQYLTCYARVRAAGAWNTTTQQGGVYASHTPSEEVVELARRAQASFDLAFTSVDVVETDAGPLVFEVSAFGGFRGLKEGTGMDAAAALAEHVVGRMAHGR